MGKPELGRWQVLQFRSRIGSMAAKSSAPPPSASQARITSRSAGDTRSAIAPRNADSSRELFTQDAQGVAHTLVGRNVHGDRTAARRRRGRGGAVQSDHVPKPRLEPLHHGAADAAAASGDQDETRIGRQESFLHSGQGISRPAKSPRPRPAPGRSWQSSEHPRPRDQSRP